jgi:hypothetical protein
LAGSLPIVYPFYFPNKSSYALNKKPVIVGFLYLLWLFFVDRLSPACLSLYGRFRIFPEMKLNTLPDNFISKVTFWNFPRSMFLQPITTSNAFNF